MRNIKRCFRGVCYGGAIRDTALFNKFLVAHDTAITLTLWGDHGGFSADGDKLQLVCGRLVARDSCALCTEAMVLAGLTVVNEDGERVATLLLDM